MPTDESLDFLKAQVLVLHTAIASVAAVSPQRQEILAYFDHAMEQLMADLLPLPASEKVVASVQAHAADFRRVLAAETTPPKP